MAGASCPRTGAAVDAFGGCTAGAEVEGFRFERGRGIGIAVADFEPPTAASCDPETTVGASSAIVGCSGAGEAEGGGTGSGTSRSREACAA